MDMESKNKSKIIVVAVLAQQPPLGHGLLIHEVS